MKITTDRGYINYSISDMDDNVIIIDLVEVNEKRQGAGTELVNAVLNIAREQGKSVELCAYPQDDSISLADLVSFYEGLGFHIVDDCGFAVDMAI